MPNANDLFILFGVWGIFCLALVLMEGVYLVCDFVYKFFVKGK